MARTKKEVVINTPEVAVEKKSTHLAKRGFTASVMNRFTSDWVTSPSLNSDLQQGLKTLRDRSRGLSVNNEYMRRYLKLVKSNIVGPEGIALSVQATLPDKSMDGFNDVIENEFWKWGETEHCTVTGKLDWRKVQELVLESAARDGEALVWLRRGYEFGKYSFQLQLLDADHLDENYNATMADGNQVVQGVEVNAFGRPTAYHLWQKNPADVGTWGTPQANRRIRVSAEDILHIFDQERGSQVRGFPWATAAMAALNHIEKYREAELIGARISAAKQLFYKQRDDSDPFVDDDEEVDDQGNVTFEVSPGAHQILPKGWSVETVEYSKGSTSLSEFQKSVLRGAAASLGVSYNSLSSDLESVNYSSARFGGLEDQALYRSTQRWFINALIKPVYLEWLKIQLLTNSWGLNIPFDKYGKFSNVRFIPRTWQSVDRVKDSNADLLELGSNLTSHSDVIAKSGRDPDEVFAQIAKDKEKMLKLGITTQDVVENVKSILDEEKKASKEQK